MDQITALIDGNNFYAACEQSIDPAIAGHPVVVLSNNDGCVIARSTEARGLGISMGVPYFKIQHKLKRLGIIVRSSNYALYGDMSQRLMSLLEKHCDSLEIYSIDEAFARLSRPINNDLYFWARHLRSLAYQNLGITISIGIGHNKLQAKLANNLAKTIDTKVGIFDLLNPNNYEEQLEKISIEEVWGIGCKMAHCLRTKGVNTAKQLRDMPSNELKSQYGVVGLRLQNELRGEICFPFREQLTPKKETCVSRSFSKPVTSIQELRQAIATYVVMASEKLRKQGQKAGTIKVFARTNLYHENPYNKSATTNLETASNNTTDLLAASLPLTEQIFENNKAIIKAGIIMQNLETTEYLQGHLFSKFRGKEQKKRENLIVTVDQINNRYGNGSINWAICGTNQRLRMRRVSIGRYSTTQIKNIPVVKA